MSKINIGAIEFDIKYTPMRSYCGHVTKLAVGQIYTEKS